MDNLTPQQRSENMRRVRSKGTKPEIEVRRLVHALGYRYRLHRKTLPGKPDLVFPSRRKIILVHGCFWHQHDDPGCKAMLTPKSNVDFWSKKLAANVGRDAHQLQQLLSDGWRVLVVWECQIGNRRKLTRKITQFLD
jgi:DNA mismatch endonuclease (patch repair protein)